MWLLLIFKCQAICIGAKGVFSQFRMRSSWLHDVFWDVSGWHVKKYEWPQAVVLALLSRLCPWAGFPRKRHNARCHTLCLRSQLLALGPVKARQKLVHCSTNSYLVLRVGSTKWRPCTSNTNLGRLVLPCPLWVNESKVGGLSHVRDSILSLAVVSVMCLDNHRPMWSIQIDLQFC